MAAPVRRTDPSLEDILLERPLEFDFFQAVAPAWSVCIRTQRLISRVGQPLDNSSASMRISRWFSRPAPSRICSPINARAARCT